MDQTISQGLTLGITEFPFLAFFPPTKHSQRISISVYLSSWLKHAVRLVELLDIYSERDYSTQQLEIAMVAF